MKFIREGKQNNKGFTLSETLASLLILALVIVIIGGGVIVVKDAYQRITLKANAQVLMSTAISKVQDELKFAESIDDTASPVTFTSGNNNYKLSFENGDGTKENLGIMEVYGEGTTAQPVQMLSTKTMTNGLVPSIEYSYDSTRKLFTATVTVKDKDGTVKASQKFNVKPLNV